MATVTDTTVDAEDLNDVDGLTEGLVTCSSATTLTGTRAEVQAALTANVHVVNDEGTVTTQQTIAGLNTVNVTLSDETAGTQTSVR